MNKQDVNNTWLGPVLEQHLGRIAAPDELWDRIETPRFASAGNAGRRVAWALAAAMVLVAIVWGFHLRGATSIATSIDMPAPNRLTGPACLLCHVAMVQGIVPDQRTALN